MPLKITSPLFATDASGTIKGIGTFRQTAAGTYLVAEQPGNVVPVPATATLRACFSTAKALHSAITPFWVFAGGRYRLRRTPAWPAYWTQYLIDNPACLI